MDEVLIEAKAVPSAVAITGVSVWLCVPPPTKSFFNAS